MNRPDHLDELDTLFGPAAVMDLDQRGLLPTLAEVDPGDDRRPGPGGADRIHGALLGAAIGNALGLPTRHLAADEVTRRFGRVEDFVLPRQGPRGEHPLGAEGRLLVSWAGRLASKAKAAAPALSSRLEAGRPRLDQPGSAIAKTTRRLRKGMPWYAAAPDSLGNGALLRAVADGARWATDPAWRPRSAALGCLVTHAHPRAVSSSIVLAELVAAAVNDPDRLADPRALAVDVAARLGDEELRRTLGRPTRTVGDEPVAAGSLARALDILDRHADPREALLAAVAAGGPSDVVAGVVGALVGARFGPDAFPPAWRATVAQRDRIRRRAQRLAEAQDLGSATADSDGGSPVHIWFLIDRSGSMEHLSGAVVDGFNAFLAEQQSTPGQARLTLVQFDSDDPYEVLVDGARLDAVEPLRRHQFQARGATPLYDAIGALIDAADARAKARARQGKPAEDQLVVVFTDGHENASQRWDRRKIFGRITRRKAKGWTFVYLGANQDSYGVGHDLGVAQGSVSNYEASPMGMHLASASVSRAAREWRTKSSHRRHREVDDFFEGVKEAEADASPPAR